MEGIAWLPRFWAEESPDFLLTTSPSLCPFFAFSTLTNRSNCLWLHLRPTLHLSFHRGQNQLFATVWPCPTGSEGVQLQLQRLYKSNNEDIFPWRTLSYSIYYFLWHDSPLIHPSWCKLVHVVKIMCSVGTDFLFSLATKIFFPWANPSHLVSSIKTCFYIIFTPPWDGNNTERHIQWKLLNCKCCEASYLVSSRYLYYLVRTPPWDDQTPSTTFNEQF